MLEIAGFDGTSLRIVSSYDIDSDTWIGNLPNLNQARYGAGAVFSGAHVFVFCGNNGNNFMNTIEKIASSSLM